MASLFVWVGLCLNLASCVSQRYIAMPPAPEGKVVVYGFVNKQGEINWSEGMTLSDCLAKAGGYHTSANQRDLTLLEPVSRHGRVYMRKSVVEMNADAYRHPLLPGSFVVVNDRMPEF